MIVKKLDDIPLADMHGYEGVSKKLVLGPDDGSAEIVLRHFSVQPGGATPHHAHDFPHLVKVETGTGVLVDMDGQERPLQSGDFVFVAANEVHHFANTGAGPFEFICIVPRRGEA